MVTRNTNRNHRKLTQSRSRVVNRAPMDRRKMMGNLLDMLAYRSLSANTAGFRLSRSSKTVRNYIYILKRATANSGTGFRLLTVNVNGVRHYSVVHRSDITTWLNSNFRGIRETGLNRWSAGGKRS